MDLRHVLWIGGATGSGKTSVPVRRACPRAPATRGRRPLVQMIDRVEERLAPAIEALPRAVDRPAVRRLENDVLARQVRLYRDSGDAPGDAPSDEWTLPFACECERPGCADVLELSLADYERLSAAGDRSPLRAPRS